MDTSLFLSTGYAPDLQLTSESGVALPFTALSPFLRTLLITDGTVTKSLESYFWEPVAVTNVEQSLRVCHGEKVDSYLNLGDGEAYLARRVDLIGQDSQKHYLSADSHFAVEHLPKEIRQELEQMKIGIGEILRECGLETYREIKAFGFDGEHSVWREYLIFIDSVPTIKIRETFGLESF